MDKIRLLKFPFPFQAALTICSDIDGAGWEKFLAIHRFLNSKQNTEMGPGLGLPIGDSFWLYDEPGIPNSAFSYFVDQSGKESEVAAPMRELIQAGILDVMHSYGNFHAANNFQRELARRGLEELDRQQLKVKVWTNHGGATSYQNIGARSLGRGDIKFSEDPRHPSAVYHSDLLIQYGIQFYWDSEASLLSVVGQDRPAQFSEFYWKSPLNFNFKMKAKSLLKSMVISADKVYSSVTEQHFLSWQPANFNNQLLSLDTLRDNQRLFLFRRFGNGRLDWSEDLATVLNNGVLEKLLLTNGYLILYLHLADRRDRNEPQPLSRATIEKLEQLAGLYAAKQLWIATTSTLLAFNLAQRFLVWSAEEFENFYRIDIAGLALPGNETNTNGIQLNGLSFVLPSDRDVKIFFKDKELNIQKVVPADGSNQIAVIPLTSTEWPW